MAARTSIVLRTSKSPLRVSVGPSVTIFIVLPRSPCPEKGLACGPSHGSILRDLDHPVQPYLRRPSTTMTRPHPHVVAPRPDNSSRLRTTVPCHGQPDEDLHAHRRRWLDAPG